MRYVVLAVIALLVPRVAISQDPASAAFDAVSIKPNSSGAPQMVVGTPPNGDLNAINVTPRFLIRFAFETEDALIVGTPPWALAEHFDIKTTGSPASPAAVRERIRALLRDRFGLRVRKDQQVLPVYLLTAAGKREPQLREAQGACRSPTAEASPAPPVVLPEPGTLPCGLRPALGHLSGGSVSMSDVARVLSRSMDRVVVDRTGLVGGFDLVLNYTPDALRLSPATADVNGGTSVFTAVREQLGLRLVPDSASVEVLVIDHIERPSEN